MRSVLWTCGLVFGAAFLGACASTPSQGPVTAVPDGPRPIIGWLAGPAGAALDDSDRERAFAAQSAAAETGLRASWRSTKGHFGFVEPGPEATTSAGPCRPFVHTLYVDGRAQRGGGTACRNAAGTWDVVS